jgi:hypothetical protein
MGLIACWPDLAVLMQVRLEPCRPPRAWVVVCNVQTFQAFQACWAQALLHLMVYAGAVPNM